MCDTLIQVVRSKPLNIAHLPQITAAYQKSVQAKIEAFGSDNGQKRVGDTNDTQTTAFISGKSACLPRRQVGACRVLNEGRIRINLDNISTTALSAIDVVYFKGTSVHACVEIQPHDKGDKQNKMSGRCPLQDACML